MNAVTELNTFLAVEEFKSIHGNKFDYSLVNFIADNQKVDIICCSCNVKFSQTPKNHRRCKVCKYCYGNYKKTTEQYIQDCVKVHGSEEFDYSKVNYKNAYTKIVLIHKCGYEFETKPNNHLTNKSGCPKCANNIRLTKEQFVEKSNLVHYENKYNYDKVVYSTNYKKVEIFCNDCNKSFKQSPMLHMVGGGCPKCSESRGEKEISKILDQNNIKYISQYKPKGCKDKRQLSFDFYVPSLNLLIEYDGKQHFEPVKYWGGKETLENVKRRDSIKDLWADKNGVGLLRITYRDDIKLTLTNKI